MLDAVLLMYLGAWLLFISGLSVYVLVTFLTRDESAHDALSNEGKSQ